jgi:hypothetical protein
MSPDKIAPGGVSLVRAGRLGVGSLSGEAWVLLTVPLVLAGMMDWTLGWASWLDAWVYTGYMLDLPARLREFPDAYYGWRVAWVIPGYLVHQLFPPVTAHLVLRLALLYGSALSVYVIVRNTFGDRLSALVTALLTVTYQYLLLAIGWDYPDGAGITYWLAATAMLTSGRGRSTAPVWPLAGGALWAAMLHTNVFLVTFTPLVVGCLIQFRSTPTRRGLIGDGLLFAAGAGGMTLLLGVVSVGLGGRFLFFLPSLELAFNFVGTPWQSNVPRPPRPLLRTPWLALPAVIAVTASITVLQGRRGPADERWPARRFWQLQFLGAVLLMLSCELLGQRLFTYAFYASFLIPPMFLAFGAQLAPLLDRLGPTRGRLFAATLVAGWVAPVLLGTLLSPAGPSFLSEAWAARELDRAVTWLVTRLRVRGEQWTLGAVGLFWLGTSAPLLPRAKTAMLLLLALGLGGGHYMSTANISGDRNATPLTRSDYLAGITGFEVIRSWARDGDVRLWYDAKETEANGGGDLGSLYRMIAGMHMWGRRLLNFEFPRLDRSWRGAPLEIPSPTRIVVMTRRPNVLELAGPPLEQRGLRPRLLEAREIPDGSRTFTLTLIAVEFDDRRLNSAPSYVATNWRDWNLTTARPTVTRDEATASTRIVTNRSTYDWQIVSRPLAVASRSGYLLRARLAIDSGGAGIHVMGSDGRTVLASRYWCRASSRPFDEEVTFDTDGNREVSIAISNCGETPTTSVFSISKLELWQIQRDD